MPRVDRCQAPAAPDQETETGRCAKPLVNNDGTRKPAGTKCCSRACRERRRYEQGRLKRERAARGAENLALPEHLQLAADAIAGKVQDAAHEVLKEEVRPVIQRELLTADVLDGLHKLVNLVPDAIEALSADIKQDSSEESFDADRRQRAYTLLLKYTAGNATIAPPSQEQAAAPMQVIFEMPRPGDTSTAPGESAPQPPDVVELRDCTECEATKPTGDFVGGSQRCNACQAILEDMIKERFS